MPACRATAAAAGLLATLVVGLLPAPTIAAATVTDTARVEVLAAPSASGTVLEGQALSVSVTLSNTGSRATGPLEVELRLDGARAADPAEVSAWFTGADRLDQPSLDAGSTAARASVGALEPGASAVLDLVVPAGSAVWRGPFGARLAEVAVGDRGTWLALDRTAVVRVPVASTIPVAATTFVVPIATPGEPTGLLSAETLERVTAESGSLTRTLAASAGRPVLLAVDPRVLASIRVLGAAAPSSALDFLERLEAAPNERFLLPWADADPLAPLDATQQLLPLPDGTGLLAGEPFAADVEADSTTAPSPQPSGPPDGPAAEQATTPIADLIDLVTTFDGALWLERPGLGEAALDALVDDGARLAITPSSALEGDDVVQRHGALVLLRADEALAAAARQAAAASSQQQFERAMAHVSALLAAGAADSPGAPAVIALSREAQPGGDRLLDTIARTVSLPWSTGSTASSAASRTSTTAVVIDAPEEASRRSAVESALSAERADRQFAQIALTPALLSDTRRLELLAALSQGWGEASVEALQGFVAESQQLRSSVQVVESSAILLLTDRATLPVTVQNDLDVAVRVFVRVEPDTAQLRVLDPDVEATVEPRSQTRTLVPVESLTNGEVDITVTVRDAQGRVLSDPTRVALNLQAGWETAGTIVVAIAVALLFIVGIIRDLRKRRRRAADSATQTIIRPDSPRKDSV